MRKKNNNRFCCDGLCEQGRDCPFSDECLEKAKFIDKVASVVLVATVLIILVFGWFLFN